MLFGFLCSIRSLNTGGQVDLVSSGVGLGIDKCTVELLTLDFAHTDVRILHKNV